MNQGTVEIQTRDKAVCENVPTEKVVEFVNKIIAEAMEKLK